MRSYTLKYKRPGQLLWRKLKNVTFNYIQHGVWVIVFEDDSQMVLPIDTIFFAGPDRHQKYKEDMERDAGQGIPTNPGGNWR